jgi:hypothetical protein
LNSYRWASAAAVTYVALFVAAHLLTTKGPCGTACFARATDERVVAFYGDSGNRWRVGIAYLLFGVGLAAFLWFLARLHSAIAEIEGPGTLARLVILGGGVYAALQAAGTAVYAAVATGPGLVTDEEHYRVNAAVVRAAGDVSWMLRSLGSVAAAVLAVVPPLPSGARGGDGSARSESCWGLSPSSSRSRRGRWTAVSRSRSASKTCPSCSGWSCSRRSYPEAPKRQ